MKHFKSVLLTLVLAVGAFTGWQLSSGCQCDACECGDSCPCDAG